MANREASQNIPDRWIFTTVDVITSGKFMTALAVILTNTSVLHEGQECSPIPYEQ